MSWSRYTSEVLTAGRYDLLPKLQALQHVEILFDKHFTRFRK